MAREMWAGMVVCVYAVATLGTAMTSAPATETLSIRGHAQTLYIYGRPQGDPVVVSSGDGGWIHLGPHVAELLSAKGYFVVGFDAKAYLSAFTAGKTTLQTQDAAGDYRVLADFAARATGRKPILIGVSEGAGLSVLAASDVRSKTAIAGVIALGLPDMNELGWRWKDSVIYLTHTRANEPMFSAAAIVDKVAPLPLAAIYSMRDEFVPAGDAENILRHAAPPKQLWVVSASNHRFSDNLREFDARLIDAIGWVRQNGPARSPEEGPALSRVEGPR
jgi:virulence protein VirJ